MKQKRFFIWILILLLAAAQTALGEELFLNSTGIVNRALSVDPTGLREGFSAVLYDNTNGLPTSEANAITETSDGFIWIGSYAGLIRYDGNTFDRIDLGGLASIKCLYVDSRDRLWIGSNDNGVAVMSAGEVRKWNKADGMKSSHTRAITEGPDGTIYIATTVGIAMIDPDNNLTMMEDEAGSLDMRNFSKAPDGTIYGTSDRGDIVIIRDRKQIRFISIEENPLKGAGAIMADPAGGMKIYHEAADYCLYHVDLSDGFTILEKLNIDPLRYLLSMEYIDGRIWITAGNGIGVLENGTIRMLDNLPLNNNVSHVMTDYLGNLWFTSTRQGVLKVVPNRFSDLFARYGIEPTVVNSTCVCDGMLFVGTDTGLIVLDERGPVDSVPLTKAVSASGEPMADAEDLISLLSGARIRSIIADSRGRMWISTWRAKDLLCYDRGEVTMYSTADGLLSANLRAVAEKQDGSFIVGLTGGANIIQDGQVTASFGAEDGIENVETLTVAEGLQGEILVGSNGGGLSIFTAPGTEAVKINVEQGLPSDIVMRLKTDRKRNVVWIVTSSALAYMTPDYQITWVEKFPYTNNFDLYENSKGDMWVLSSNGIYVVPGDELIANGEINAVFYSVANGLPCIATANSYSHLTPEGDLYIAGSTGICKVNIEQEFENVADLKASVPYLEADGERVYPDASGTFTIDASTQKLTVPSHVFNYALNNPQVGYQLEGFERHATTVSRKDMVPVDFTNLRGGSYRFVMRIADSMGRGNKEVSVRIEKKKAFYEETWFFVLVGLAGLGLLVTGVGLYIRRKTRLFEKQHQAAREQFEQTAEALAGAIDAKDRYTNGHSRRVAEYSLRIAEAAGLDKEECDKVYFAALLHDVGKIGVPLEILAKKGKLTDEEFEQIKQHPVVGGQILNSIRQSPWLSIGARFHHERYNGRGYPEGRKGEEIPEIARIIAVADAYDAMTSNRSYRSAIPQHIVREELVKGLGAQFDPRFAQIMIHMIDQDTDFQMQEKQDESRAPAKETGLRCETIYHDCSGGIQITAKPVKINLCSQPDQGVEPENSLPSLIVFDSLDGKVHPGEENNKDLLYCEYAQIRLDGKVTPGTIRQSEVKECGTEGIRETDPYDPIFEQRYEIRAVRYRDHMMVQVSDPKRIFQVILALPDTSRYVYIAIGGEKCDVHNIRTATETAEIGPADIPRIAEEISHIQDCPEGDVPNVEVTGWRAASTEGIPIEDNLTLTFHTRSLPAARLVWHCPFVSVFTSADGKVNGPDYHEYLLLRMDGERWESDEQAENRLTVERKPEFGNWNIWKEKNKEGLDCTVTIRRNKNEVRIRTENLGIAIESVTILRERTGELYAALTGDQCALTNIRITR